MAIDWMTIDKAKGDGDSTLGVSVSENALTVSRNARIKITSTDGSIVKYVSVIQEGKEEDYLNVSPSTIGFPKEGGTHTISIGTNGTWTVTAPDWMTVSRTTGSGNATLTVTVGDNATGAELNGEIIVSVGAISKTVRVFQSKDETVEYLEVSPANIEFDYDGGEEFITITASGSWIITTPDWIEVTTNGGNGDKILMVKADKSTVSSDRSGVITITMGNRSATVNVIQRYTGKLTISPSSVVFFYTGTYQSKNSITVSSTGAWTSSKADDWFSMNKTSGSSGDTVIRFTAQSWSGTEPRSGKVNFYLDGQLKATAVISQLQQSYKTTIIEYTKRASDGDGAVEPNIPDVFGVPIIANFFDYTNTDTGSYKINRGQYYVAGTVKEVKANGFKNCLLNSITLPDTVEKIGDYAFINTHLSYFDYPSSTYDVGVGAFMNTRKMNTIITNNLITEIKDYTFFNSKFDSGYDGECILGKNITKIGNNAFSYNTLKRLFIPTKMQEINKNAFISAFNDSIVNPMMCFTGAKPLVKSNGAIADVGGFTDIGGLDGLLTHFPTYDYSSWFQGDSSFVKQNWNNRSYDSSNEINYVSTDGGLSYPIVKVKNISLDDTFNNYYKITSDIADFFGNILISNTYNGKGKWVFAQEIKNIGCLFASDTKVKEIELPNSVLTLGVGCFSIYYGANESYSDANNKVLEVIRLGNGIQEVRASAFDSLPNLTDIYITTVTAPSINGTPSTIDRPNITLHYPSGSDYSTWIEKYGFTGVADL